MAGNGNSGGHNARSTQAHVLAGTFRNDRHGDHETPEPPKGRPEPPKELTGDALDEWTRMVDRLERSGSLSKVDDAAIYQYAKLFAEAEATEVKREALEQRAERLDDAMKELKGADLSKAIDALVGLEKLIARCGAELRADRMGLRQWLCDFGMTPASRGRVKLPAKKPQSKVESFRAKKAGHEGERYRTAD